MIYFKAMKSLYAQLAPCRKEEEVESEFCKMKIDVEIGRAWREFLRCLSFILCSPHLV